MNKKDEDLTAFFELISVVFGFLGKIFDWISQFLAERLMPKEDFEYSRGFDNEF